MMEWIPIIDYLPKELERVLTYSPTSHEPFKIDYLISFSDNSSIWACRKINEIEQNITHWMPLTKPPNENK